MKVRVALLQCRGFQNREEALAETEKRIAEAARGGANIICTQELFLTPYFCRTQSPELFDLAEEIPGKTTEFFAEVAKKYHVVLILSLFEKRACGLYHNTAAVLDADGTFLGKYRKMHIPQDPGFEEKFYFTPGDLGFKAWTTKFGRIGVIVCWDQWYPESVRLTALDGAQIIFCPTAIGSIASEPAELGLLQRTAWRNAQTGHSVANACYYAAVNRVGREGDTSFWGTSFLCDFYGRRLAEGSMDREEILVADCDLNALEEHRRMWPFFRDRRIDAYAGLERRWND